MPFGAASRSLHHLRAVPSARAAARAAPTRFGGSASIPLAAASRRNMKYEIKMQHECHFIDTA
jgi:hypothetical protein